VDSLNILDQIRTYKTPFLSQYGNALDNPTPTSAFERTTKGWGSDWDEANALWEQSQQEGFLPGMLHKLGAGLTTLDMPRRAAWRAFSGITDPVLRGLGIEHPEDLVSGFEVGNKLGELYTPQVAPAPGDAGFLEKAAKELEYRIKGLPTIAAQTAGNVFDIYTDPLGMISIKKPTLLQKVGEEVTKPFVPALESIKSAEAGGNRNPTLSRQFTEITPENLQEVSTRYMQTRVEDKIQELLNARQEIKLVPDISRQRELLEYVDNQLTVLEQAGKALADPSYRGMVENFRQQDLPDMHTEGLASILNPWSHKMNRAYPQVESLDIDPSVPAELQKVLPYDYSFLSPSTLAERQARLEKALETQKEGLKLTLPIPGAEQVNIPLITDLTGALGRGIGKLGQGAKEIIHKLIYKAPSVKDAAILDQPVPPNVLQAVNDIFPQTRGHEIKARDLEGLLAYISQTPGGVKNYVEARDWAGRLAGTNQGLNVLEKLDPIYEYLGTLGDLSPYKQETLSNLRGAFQAARDDIMNARQADIFQKSYQELQADNITFDQLRQANSRRIHHWLLRQFKQNPNNTNLANELIAYTNDAARVGRAQQRFQAMTATDWVTEDNLEKALIPNIDRLATLQSIDDMITARKTVLDQERANFQTAPDTLTAAQRVINAYLDNRVMAEVIPQAIEQIGLQSKFSPPPWMMAADDNQMLRGLVRHIDDLDLTAQEYLQEVTSWYRNTDANQLINLLYSSPSKVQSALSDAVSLWHSAYVQNPAIGPQLTDPGIVAALLENSLNIPATDPRIVQFANAFAQASAMAQREWIDLTGKLSNNLALLGDQHQNFLSTLLPMRAMAAEKEAFLRPVYEQFVFSVIPEFKAAKQFLFNPSKENIPARAKLWQSFMAKYTDYMRGVWRDFGMEPEAVEMTKAAMRNVDYWNQRVANEAEEEVINGIYRKLLEDAGIPFDYRKIDLIDQGVVYRYGYQNNLDRIQQGTNMLLEAFNGDAAAAENAFQRWKDFHETRMNFFQVKDNQAGIPTPYRQQYLPHMLKAGSTADYKRVSDAIQQRRKTISTPSPGLVGADYMHQHQRDFRNLDEFEEFLAQLNAQQSANPYFRVAASELQPETSYIRLYAQRARNHFVAANSLQFLREMEVNFPHLIQSMREVDRDLDALLKATNDPSAQLMGVIGGSEELVRETTPVSSRVAAPTKWDVRRDYANYLQTYIPYSADTVDPANIVERAFKALSVFNYKLQNLNTAFNGPGHVKNILANALVGNINFRLAWDNMAKYGPNPRNHPLYDDAARAGVFPWAGIDHNKNIREVMDIRMGRPKTGDLEKPVKYSSTSPAKEMRLGKWTIFRTPGVGADRILGFMTKMREPEYSRFFTWEFMDKNLRLAMYEQALEMGMSKTQSADFVRNALIDYQMSWMNARTKMYANAVFPFFSWWIGNLRLHLPNMIQEPRFYVIANHTANLANWYATGNYREDNPDGLTSAISLPVQNGPELLYFQLGLPWETMQNKLVKGLYDIWMAPASVEDKLDLAARLVNTGHALGTYVSSRARSIPVELIKALLQLRKYAPGYVTPSLRHTEDLAEYWWALAAEQVWGLTPVVAPGIEYAYQNITGGYPAPDLPTTLLKTGLGMMGPVNRVTATGEVKEF